MTRRTLLLILAAAAASLVLVSRRTADRDAGGGPARGPVRPATRRAAPAVDPSSIRDVFRFDDPAPAAAPRLAAPRPAASEPPAAPAPEALKLVGLVRRDGTLLAAFSVQGDVVLAGAGDTVGGVTVVEVGDEGVRIRRADGSEERIALP